jgi:hypothetical protein
MTYTYFTPYVRAVSFFSGVMLAHVLESENKVILCSNEKVSDIKREVCYGR